MAPFAESCDLGTSRILTAEECAIQAPILGGKGDMIITYNHIHTAGCTIQIGGNKQFHWNGDFTHVDPRESEISVCYCKSGKKHVFISWKKVW